MTPKTIAGFSSALVALAVALLSAYISLKQEVQSRPSDTQVRQLIDDRTSDKFFEMFRRFDRLDQRFDRLDQELSKQNNKRN